MKYTLGLIGLCLLMCAPLRADGKGSEREWLLSELDRAIACRQHYSNLKQRTIDSLKQRRAQLTSWEKIYQVNTELIDAYATFICDSAEYYIHDNIKLARSMGNENFLLESRLRLAFVYSLSGLFVQANEIFTSIRCSELPDYLKAFYGWNCIRYCENFIRYADDNRFSALYAAKKEAYRDTVMSVLDPTSDMYRKELAFKLQYQGKTREALDLLHEFYEKETPGTHGYAMLAMAMAKAYEELGDSLTEERYLIQAAIADKKSAIKDNEALLSLAWILYKEGEIDRAYNYVKAALEDANFYNSRFKNTIIARIHPIIENTYLTRLKEQKLNLQVAIALIVLFILVLAGALVFIYKQMKLVVRARNNLKEMNRELSALNATLNETSAVKEKYVGYFMNQCALYVSRLDDYRREVVRKLKADKIEELLKKSSKPFERELADLYANFDKAFLQLYPRFLDDFNMLLRPNERFVLPEGSLNIELRIYALMRLGVTNMGQVASFLHCSPQTVYNYKCKLKKMSDLDGDEFDELVKKIGAYAPAPPQEVSSSSTL